MGLDMDSKASDDVKLSLAIVSSSTKWRISELSALNSRLLRSDPLPLSCGDIVGLLFRTYPFYRDRPSRKAVQECLWSLLGNTVYNDALTICSTAFKRETSKTGLAPSNTVVLAEWGSILLQHCAVNARAWAAHGIELVEAHTRVLDLCLSFANRPSIKRSALVVTWRALRRLFKDLDNGEARVRAIVGNFTGRSQSLGIKSACLLGAVAGVCARVPGLRSVLAATKTNYFSFYVQEVVGSRTIVPQHYVESMNNFFSHFVSLEDLHRELVPAFEKTLLRAPEVVLNDILSPLIHSLPPDVDLSEALATRLLKPLLSNVRSTNAKIRDGGVSAFTALIVHSRKLERIEKVAEEVLVPLSTAKLASADHRTAYSKMLASLPFLPSHSASICKSVSVVTSKEQNEAALSAEASAIVHHLLLILEHSNEIDPSVLNIARDTFARGISDKKLQLRRIWILGAGDFLWHMQEFSTSLNSNSLKRMRPIVEAMVSQLIDVSEEMTSNVQGAGQSGLALAGYILLACFGFLSDFVTDEQIKSTLCNAPIRNQSVLPKASFLLHHRVYTRLPERQYYTWAIRALISFFMEQAENCGSSVIGDAWGQAFIFLAVATDITQSIRKEAAAALTQVYLQHPSPVARSIIKALWTWTEHLATSQQDTAASASKADSSRLRSVIQAICPDRASLSAEEKVVQNLPDQMISLLVLCRTEILPSTNWIELCLKVGQDPGELARDRGNDCVAEIETVLDTSVNRSEMELVKLAACKAAAELAFVASEIMTPLLVGKVRALLEVENVRSCNPTEIAIMRTAEGTAFIDVLNDKSQRINLDKKSRNYETLKWESEVRRQLAQNIGQERKLTADEKIKLDAQLKREAETRRKMRNLESRLIKGVGIIDALATGPPTDASLWIGECTQALLGIIDAGAELLIAGLADSAYINCAKIISPRLGSLRQFIGIGTLRALGSSKLPDDMEQEPIGELITRIFYRLRFMSEQRPFDGVSLLFIFPLVVMILRRNGIGYTEAEAIEEQITVTLEFVSFHMGLFSDERLPREEMISLLIECMQRYSQHYKLLKDCLLDLSRSIGSNVTSTERASLLQGVILPEASVRATVLQAIREHIDLTDINFIEQIWVAVHDDNEENSELGQAIWQENALDVEPDDATKVLKFISSSDKQLRSAASRALAESIGADKLMFSIILTRLQEQYRDLAKPKVAERDEFGMLKKTNLADPWEARSGIAMSFKAMAPDFDTGVLISFIEFLIDSTAIGDSNATVRDEMIDSATEIIYLHGAEKVEGLMDLFERAVDENCVDSRISDSVNEAVIILYGALARHLPYGDDRVPNVVQRLFMTLSTPSETVQYAVACCLPPLIQISSSHVSDYVQAMLDQLLQSKKYADRRGAAYGLAGIVSGRGLSTLREYPILITLKTAIENKKDQNHRQGAYFAYEVLSLILGRIFEAYIIQFVPYLLTGFGDTSTDVREACLDAAKASFRSLSSYGVKIILPTLLAGLEDTQWRSKKGACDLLGAMAYLDPQQLALSLPDIIPPLTGVLNDSHKEVRNSANRSLQRFGEVISNPEVKSLVSTLLKALSDPTKYTDVALEALIKISFVHYLDSPSLALIVRILERGLGDRSATRRKAAQIIGSLAHLTDRKDMTPHLPVLVTGLKLAVVDPVPATRATASKALGSLVEKLGEEALPDLIPGLMLTLKSDVSAGDRLGSAQALSEVLAGLGIGRLEETLPTILQNVSSSKPPVREGFMSLFVYLPACFGSSFTSYLNRIIPSILGGLADDVESIRETSLKAGRLLVKNFATKAIDLLLPELDQGLADNNYRIRLSSVELVGDLLFNLTGISGKTEHDEEEGAGVAGASLLEVLGEEKRNKVLSSIYICRCDTSGLVRSAAINVWKALVATPRTLKELVPTLTQLLIYRLASSNMEQKVIAGNALGELIRKAGEGVLASLLPTLEEGLHTSTDVDHRQGICIALREIISSASQDALEDYERTITSVVRVALVDTDSDVREAAAEAFDSLQKIFGKKAVDQVLPYLLNLLRIESDAETALAALLTLLTDNTRSNVILPNLIPTLLVSPINAFNAKAITSLAQVAGGAMTRRLPVILNTFMDNEVSSTSENLHAELQTSFDAILLAVDEFDGLNTAMSVMLGLVRNEDHRKRASANIHLSTFFANTTLDYSRYHQDLIRVLLTSFDDGDIDVVKAAWVALFELTKRLRKEEIEGLVLSTRTTLQQVGVPGHSLPGFSLPKGIGAILPIFSHGLLNGNPEQRVQAALAISDVIDRTDADGLKLFVTQLAGPLIRAVSERSIEVKSAVLLTLNHLLEKIPTHLKPFLPQLQRTFAKSLADTSSEILRSRAAQALGTLITLTPRIDPLIAELVAGSKTPDVGVQNAMLKALYEVVSKAGMHMNETSRASILGLIESESSHVDDSMNVTNARLLGALVKSLPSGTNAANLIKHRVLTSHITSSSILNLNSVLLESPTSLTRSFKQETAALLCQGMSSKNTFISDNSVVAAGKYLLACNGNDDHDHIKSIIEALAVVIQPGNPVDTRRLSLVVVRTVSRQRHKLISSHLRILAPPVFASVRDIVIPVKLASEAAFLSIFSVEESGTEEFDKFIASEEPAINAATKRSMQDYFKRVAIRLGTQARERREAEGGQGGLGLSNDEKEDEREIWSVGQVDLGEGSFNDK